MSTIPYSDFEKIDLRVGRIINIEDFPEARKPAYKLMIDFGEEIGVKKSSAQITELYSKDDLMHRLIVCVTNFAPKQIGPFISEVLTCGVENSERRVVLLACDRDVPLGSRIF